MKLNQCYLYSVVTGVDDSFWYRRSCRRWVADLEFSDLGEEQESRLLRQFLRNFGGVDADKVGPVADLLALALVNSGWRNTCVENWHAAGLMDDGEMMRINSHTTWNVRRRVRSWMAENDLAPDTPASALDRFPSDAGYHFTAPIYSWLVNLRRKLPAGTTLGALAGDRLPEYERDADRALTAFALLVEGRGMRFSFLRAGAHGALACRHWWGHPKWPVTVDRFLRALDDPHDQHWGPGAPERVHLKPEPAVVADRALLRRKLLSGPWKLDPDAARWLVSAGIGHLYY